MKLENIVCEYLKDSLFSFKQSTYYHYLKLVETYLSCEEIDSKNLDETKLNESILKTLETKCLSYSTLKVLKSLINRALNYAYNKKILKKPLQLTIEFKKNERKNIECLNKEEVNALEKYILAQGQTYKFGFLISLYTGLRIGELLSLKWEDVNLKERTINVKTTLTSTTFEHKFTNFEAKPKTKTSIRVVPISKNLIPLLKALKEKNKESKYVITSRNGKRVFIRAYQESFARLLKKLNIKHYGFHSLRHTFATRCYQNGMDIKSLSEILGHSSPTITLKIYVHTNFDVKLKAIDDVLKKIKSKS